MSNANNDIARLEGARLVSCLETDIGNKLSAALIKSVTGEDAITARCLYQEFHEFEPEFKLFMATNHLPSVFMDEAMLRRILMINFNVAIDAGSVEKDLIEKLRAEYPGILRWCVEGCLEWQRIGLNPPQEVKDACNTYGEEMDDLRPFIDEKVLSDSTKKYPVKGLYKAYQLWCMEDGETTLGKRDFNNRLRAKGFVSKRGRGNINEWIGISLK